MTKCNFMKPIYVSIAVVAALLFTGCRVKQDLSYMQDLNGSKEGVIARSDYRVKLQPDDELAIFVTSEIPEATAGYNLPPSSPVIRPNGNEASGLNMHTYVIDRSGDINFPILGDVHVEGMTVDEVRKMLTERIGQTVKDPIVKVRLVNFKVNVMGEVRAPGSVSVTTERFSLLDALAAAGDLTEYGNRENITVLRELADGQIAYSHLNLRDSKITESPYFYMQQNDVVLVEPNSVKQANSKYNQNNSYKLSLTSTIVSAASVIASLIIALTVK